MVDIDENSHPGTEFRVSTGGEFRRWCDEVTPEILAGGAEFTRAEAGRNRDWSGLIETLLVKKNEQLHEQMRELKSRHAAVERAIASIEKYRKSPTNGTVSLEYIDRRYTYGRPCRHNFYEMDAASFEKELMALRQELVKKGFLHVHSYNVGTTITQVNFEQGVFIPEESFVFVDHKDRDIVPGVKVLDSGMFACIYLDHFDEETAYALKLRDHCRAQGWIIDGDYICEIITEFNVFDSEKRSMFMRLQVPVRFS